MDIWRLGGALRADVRSRACLALVIKAWQCHVEKRRWYWRRRFRQVARRQLRRCLRRWWELLWVQRAWRRHVAALQREARWLRGRNKFILKNVFPLPQTHHRPMIL